MSTRARLPRNAKSKAIPIMEASASDLSTFEDNAPGSESGSESDALSDDKPKSKRRKVSSATNKKLSSSSKPRSKATTNPSIKISRRGNAGKLSKLPELPLDVLFNIFSLLHPKDLVYLARVSKLFRSTLLAPNAASIWINSRKDYGYDCPPPREGMTESWWAWTIWDAKCSLCLKNGTPGLDWDLGRRVCKACFNSNTTKIKRVTKTFPKYDKVLPELIPITRFSVYGGGNQRYWNPDIIAVGDKLSELQRNVKRKKSGAQAALDKYVEERKQKVKTIVEYADRCKKWEGEMIQRKTDEGQEAQESRSAEITRRFKELGYEDDDIREGVRCQYRESQLTDRGWAMIRPRLEKDILSTRAQRMRKDHQTIVQAREQLLESAFDAFRSNLDPQEWIDLPPFVLIRELAIFTELMYGNEKKESSQEDFEKVLRERFPEVLTRYRQQRDSALIEAANSQYKSTVPKNETNQKEPSSPADLAISVFVCRGCPSHPWRGYYWDDEDLDEGRIPRGSFLFGAESVKRHPLNGGIDAGAYLLPHAYFPNGSHSYWNPSGNPFWRLEMSSPAATVVMELLRTIEKKAAEVTVEAMDRMDDRWICNHSECGGEDFTRPHEVFHWKAAVFHCLHKLPEGEQQRTWSLPHNPLFKLLTRSQAEEVKAKEKVINADTQDQEKIWCCRRCPAYCKTPEKTGEVKKHIVEEHGVTDPNDEDMLLAPWVQKPFLKCVDDFVLEES